MTNTYNVHIYREMRLVFGGIEADTPEAAASIARDKPTGEADNIEDCNGEDLSALVDVAGDEDYSQSVSIDFEGERHRKAAPALLAALEALADQTDEDCPGEYRSRHFTEALEEARDAVATAKAAGIPPNPVPAKQPSRFEIEHDPSENSDRVYVMVDGKFDVAIIRTDEGVVVDVYPKDGFETVATTYAFDSDVEQESSTTEKGSSL
jgi:hypothetical protein